VALSYRADLGSLLVRNRAKAVLVEGGCGIFLCKEVAFEHTSAIGVLRSFSEF
jgi:hypothetical protein